jgi:ATP-dependent Lon protease
MSDKKSQALNMPILPLRDVVVYPHMVIPLFVGRPKSIKALDSAMGDGKQIFLVAQKDPSVDEPAPNDFYEVGTVSTVLQLLKLPDGTVKVLVEGNKRAKILRFTQKELDFYSADIELLRDHFGPQNELDVVIRSLLIQFEQYVKLNKRIPPEILTSLSSIDDPARLADTIAAHVPLKIVDKQKILETISVLERLEMVLAYLEAEMDLLQIEKRIQTRVKKQMEKSQREYYLNEKMKAIQKELGELDEMASGSDIDQLKDKIEKAGMSREAKDKALAELNKLRMMPPMSAEATVVRNYLDWLLGVPWKKSSKVSEDLIKAEEILEKEHYGLEKIKERIIEYLAVQQRAKKVKGPILCLVGPPGVGKTSLGQSIANATGREFVRISLGGIRDEAEIRGHRRTYIGSMPGKIIQKLSKVKVRNPLFMLDEVDKMAMDFRGDPASALLEVLDPEQNSTFNDHYLEVDYDLSDVMFIATANSLDIPPALLDRMEVIRLAGYTEDEKINIAQKYLIPKQRAATGLKPEEILITEQAVREMIRHYTREAGVRGVERAISKICRKVVKETIMKPTLKRRVVNSKNVEKYLGVKKFRYGEIDKDNQIGQVTGLAWTEFGGELLKIEAVAIPGKGKSTFTGRLGNVMQESIHAAMTVVRSRSRLLGIPEDFFHTFDFHVHVPEGATPKDGPSAGIGMCTAIVSTLTKIPVMADVAMTGEITLRGEVLPIGGLKEKLIAALRGRVKKVIIPEENKRDLKEIPKNITQNLDIRPVRWIDQVLEIALEHLPEVITEDQEVLVVHGKNKKKELKQESAH